MSLDNTITAVIDSTTKQETIELPGLLGLARHFCPWQKQWTKARTGCATPTPSFQGLEPS
jgi:hypothetical protein